MPFTYASVTFRVQDDIGLYVACPSHATHGTNASGEQVVAGHVDFEPWSAARPISSLANHPGGSASLLSRRRSQSAAAVGAHRRDHVGALDGT
jgi:hypothetical protein